MHCARDLKPAGTPAGLRAACAIFAVLAVHVLASTGASLAGEIPPPGGDVLLGTFTPAPRAAPAADVEIAPLATAREPVRADPDGVAPAVETTTGPVASPVKAAPTAIEIFAQGRQAFADGRMDVAQSLLERVIALAPASTEARNSRQFLADIYRGATFSSEVVPAAAEQPTGSPLANDMAGRAAGTAETATAPAQQSWRARARRSHRFEDLMRSEVGDRIFFVTASAEVGSRARTVIEAQARWLSRFPELYVVVEGHADEPGDDAANDAMALRRAQTVRERLVASGVKPERVGIDVRGRRDQAATCESAVCRSQNRRAVTRVMVVLPDAPAAKPGQQGSSEVLPPGASDAQRQHARSDVPSRR